MHDLYYITHTCTKEWLIISTYISDVLIAIHRRHPPIMRRKWQIDSFCFCFWTEIQTEKLILLMWWSQDQSLVVCCSDLLAAAPAALNDDLLIWLPLSAPSEKDIPQSQLGARTTLVINCDQDMKIQSDLLHHWHKKASPSDTWRDTSPSWQPQLAWLSGNSPNSPKNTPLIPLHLTMPTKRDIPRSQWVSKESQSVVIPEGKQYAVTHLIASTTRLLLLTHWETWLALNRGSYCFNFLAATPTALNSHSLSLLLFPMGKRDIPQSQLDAGTGSVIAHREKWI